MFYLGIMKIIGDRWQDIVQEAYRQAYIDELFGHGSRKAYAQYAEYAEIASEVLADAAKALRELEKHSHEWKEFFGGVYCARCGIRKDIVR
jgi:hypothetical protein